MVATGSQAAGLMYCVAKAESFQCCVGRYKAQKASHLELQVDLDEPVDQDGAHLVVDVRLRSRHGAVGAGTAVRHGSGSTSCA